MTKMGCYGVRIDENDKLTYANKDSKSVLLEEICSLLTRFGYKPTLARWQKQARALTMLVHHDCPMTEISIQTVLTKGKAYNANEFIGDSYACEWAYIINLDTEKLEIYEGSQKKNHNRGRYSHLRIESKEGFMHMGQPSMRRQQATTHFPCALLTAIPLIDLIGFDPYKHIVPED